MSIDYNLILDTFIQVARDGVGSQLSQIGPTGSEFPAVIKVRQDGPKPDYPYITIDILDTFTNDEWLIQEKLNDSNSLVYETNKNLLINYRVYGGNAISIANDLHGYLRVASVLDFIRSETTGALLTTGNIDSLPVLLSDSFLESASFNLTFAITDSLVIPDTGSNYFDSIDLDGELKRNEDDPSPLSINVNAP